MARATKNPKHWAFSITNETMVNGDGRSCANVFPSDQPDWDQCILFDFRAVDRNLNEPFEAHLTHPSKDPGVLAEILRGAGLADLSPKRRTPKGPYADPAEAALLDPTLLSTSSKNADLLRERDSRIFTREDDEISGSSAKAGDACGYATAAGLIWSGHVLMQDDLFEYLSEIRKDEPAVYVEAYEAGWRRAQTGLVQTDGSFPMRRLAEAIGTAWAKRDRAVGGKNAAGELFDVRKHVVDSKFHALLARAYEAAWNAAETT